MFESEGRGELTGHPLMWRALAHMCPDLPRYYRHTGRAKFACPVHGGRNLNMDVEDGWAKCRSHCRGFVFSPPQLAAILTGGLKGREPSELGGYPFRDFERRVWGVIDQIESGLIDPPDPDIGIDVQARPPKAFGTGGRRGRPKGGARTQTYLHDSARRRAEREGWRIIKALPDRPPHQMSDVDFTDELTFYHRVSECAPADHLGLVKAVQLRFENRLGRKTFSIATPLGNGEYVHREVFDDELRPLWFPGDNGDDAMLPRVVVSGRYAGDALHRAVGDRYVVACDIWGDATDHVDYLDPRLLAGGDVRIWADGDGSSIAGMDRAAERVAARGCSIRRVEPVQAKEGGASGGDAVDLIADLAGITKEDVKAGADIPAEAIGALVARIEAAQPLPDEGGDGGAEDDAVDPLRRMLMVNNHFEMVGRDYTSGQLVFLRSGGGEGEVFSMPSDSIGAGRLVSIAPVEWWDGVVLPRMGMEKGLMGRGAALAVSSKLNSIASQNLDPVGTGGWGRGMCESGVYHLGDRTIDLDGNETRVSRSRGTEYAVRPALPDLEEGGGIADDLIALHAEMQGLRWDEPEDCTLVLGWWLASIIAGASWRTHVHIIGRKASGKSYVRDLGRLLLGEGRYVKTVLGSTTYAYMLHKFKSDSLAAFIEEAEAKGGNARRMEGISRYMLECSGGGAAAGRSDKNQGANDAEPSMSLMLFSTSAIEVPDAVESRMHRVGFGGGRGMSEEDFDAAEGRMNALAAGLHARAVSRMIRRRAAVYRLQRGEHWRSLIDPSRGNTAAVNGGYQSKLARRFGDRRSGEGLGLIIAALMDASEGRMARDCVRLIRRMDERARQARQDSMPDGERLIRRMLSLPVDPREPRKMRWHGALAAIADQVVEPGRVTTVSSRASIQQAIESAASIGVRLRTNGDILLDEDHPGMTELMQRAGADRGMRLREVLLSAEGVSAPRGLSLLIDGKRDRNPLCIEYAAWRGEGAVQIEENPFNAIEDGAGDAGAAETTFVRVDADGGYSEEDLPL